MIFYIVLRGFLFLRGVIILVRVLTDKDKNMVLSYLYRHNIETSLLTENVITFGLNNNKNNKSSGNYYGYFEENEMKGILPFYNYGGCLPHYESTKAIKEFAEIMANSKVDTLMGMEYIVEPLFILMREIKELQFYAQTDYLINENFKPFVLEDVEFVKGNELPSKMTSLFIKKALEEGFKLSNSDEDTSMKDNFIFLIKDDEIKAQASIQTNTDKLAHIGSVFTISSERNKGYCKAVVSEVCKRIEAIGKLPALLVRKNNTPAINAYKALGFTHYDNYLFINFANN
jgi:RimJ/RimL family protein N-acetyltransferase